MSRPTRRPIASTGRRASCSSRTGSPGLAALFAPFWLLVHRLWWPLLGYIVLSGVFELVRWVGIVDPRWISLAVIGAASADRLRGRHAAPLVARAAAVGAPSAPCRAATAAECERRFFDEWLPEQPVIAPASGSTSPRVGPPPRKTPVIGSLLGVRS